MPLPLRDGGADSDGHLGTRMSANTLPFSLNPFREEPALTFPVRRGRVKWFVFWAWPCGVLSSVSQADRVLVMGRWSDLEFLVWSGHCSTQGVCVMQVASLRLQGQQEHKQSHRQSPRVNTQKSGSATRLIVQNTGDARREHSSFRPGSER